MRRCEQLSATSKAFRCRLSSLQRLLTLATVDLQSIPHEVREQHLHGLLTSESRKAFDLAQGPLLRPCYTNCRWKSTCS